MQFLVLFDNFCENVGSFVQLGLNFFVDILEEHLREIRILRQRLENSIETNDRLREQLEKKLKQADKQASSDHGENDIAMIRPSLCRIEN